MGTRSPQQIYADLLAAGFSDAAAVTMTQIALGESGGRVDALGDQNLQDATWGPSVGLYQIRTLKAETGKGTDRDILALQGNPARQALAAYNISHRGVNFTPWSVFVSGKYAQFADQVRSGLAGFRSGFLNPLGIDIGGLSPELVDSASSKLRDLVITGGFIVLGLGLVALGTWGTVAPLQAAVAEKGAQLAAVVK